MGTTARHEDFWQPRKSHGDFSKTSFLKAPVCCIGNGIHPARRACRLPARPGLPRSACKPSLEARSELGSLELSPRIETPVNRVHSTHSVSLRQMQKNPKLAKIHKAGMMTKINGLRQEGRQFVKANSRAELSRVTVQTTTSWVSSLKSYFMSWLFRGVATACVRRYRLFFVCASPVSHDGTNSGSFIEPHLVSLHVVCNVEWD